MQELIEKLAAVHGFDPETVTRDELSEWLRKPIPFGILGPADYQTMLDEDL